ncbi:MAG TPA: ring-cleaving dioxygenase [Bryobacteraceae bacterium]|nr:ring-cleaving dioxygenase [Bryobacteraceae bacterium]
MNREIRGIHHITAIAGDPQPNLDFYAGLLGLRLVKLTINYDDPGTYHFYYGDGIGSPGTLLTFFPWPGAPRGRHGNSQATGTAFAIPSGAMQYWTERLARNGVALDGPFERFEEQVLSFPDPDGLGIELVEGAAVNAERAYTGGPVPVEYAIHGFHSATLSEEGHGQTAALLTETMGFRLLKQDGSRFRYAVAGGEPGALVDVCCLPEEPQGRMGVGTVHHIAWRTPDDAQQREWLGEITRLGYNVTPVIDRKYFKSIYYREPGGVLFEIATDGPGMSVDEAVEDLGTKLQLPPRLEPARAQLEAVLPRLRLPAAVAK